MSENNSNQQVFRYSLGRGAPNLGILDKKWKSKNIKEEVQEDSEYVTVHTDGIACFTVHSWLECGAHIKEYGNKGFIFRFYGDDVSIDDYMLKKSETPLKNKNGDLLYDSFRPTEIKVKKTDFFRYKDWVNTYWERKPSDNEDMTKYDCTRIYATKENFSKEFEKGQIYLALSISEGLSLGLLRANPRIEQKAKSKKKKIRNLIIIAIIVVIGIILFN